MLTCINIHLCNDTRGRMYVDKRKVIPVKEIIKDYNLEYVYF